MSGRTLYISRSCPHCKKLLIGIHKYEFLRPHFYIVDVGSQQYPDYIQSVPTLVVDQNMIRNDDVFGYLNNMVEQIFQRNPELKQKYHPQSSAGQGQGPGAGQGQGPGQGRGPGPGQGPIGATPQKITGPPTDPVDELVGWCPDGGCTFSPISDKNDDCSKSFVSLDDNRYSMISDKDDALSSKTPHQKVGLGQDNQQFQKTAKQQKMDESYERLMAERRLIQ